MIEYKMKHKTKDYVRKAQNNYLDKFDRCTIRLPKGASETIRQAIDVSLNTYITELIYKDMKENYGIEIK